MRQQHIMAQRRRRKAQKTESTHSFPVAPNILKRDFTADAPNQKWMTDMTFVATSQGWLYLAGVMDAFLCKLIGWAMGKEHDATLVKNALQMALLQRDPGLVWSIILTAAANTQVRAIKKCCISEGSGEHE